MLQGKGCSPSTKDIPSPSRTWGVEAALSLDQATELFISLL